MKLLRRKALQSKLGISRSTFYAWQAEGKLPPARSLNGLSVWVETEFDAWVLESLMDDEERVDA